MSTLIDLRRRIRSIRNSQQVTKAMKTVSTAKFRKAQRAVFESRPYWHSFPDLMARMVFWAGEDAHPLLAEREEKKIAVLVVASDKGLAGAFNSNLLIQTSAFLREKAQASEVRLLLVGKKAANFFRRTNYAVDITYGDKTDRLTGEEKARLAGVVMSKYVFHKIDAVYAAYNEFKSIVSPKITIEKILPLGFKPVDGNSLEWPPDWEPEAAGLLRTFLPLYVESRIHHALSESQAAEQAARMMAMDTATQNAEELITDMTLLLNKIRQASITKELLEIMTAVEALAK